jgi:ERCC4-related helicase
LGSGSQTMSQTSPYAIPPELILGREFNQRVSASDQERQRREVEAILQRLRGQPGVVVADEVGMGKTFVALAAAYAIARRSRRGPVVIMVPPNLLGKWEQDLKTFCDLYLSGVHAVDRDAAAQRELRGKECLRYGIARHSVDLMKLTDDRSPTRCHLIFLAQGALARRQTDKWLRLALVREALRRHGRGGATRLIKVKRQIHRFVGELLSMRGEERASELGHDIWWHLLQNDPAEWRELFNSQINRDRHALDDDPVAKPLRKALGRVDLSSLAEALKQMPIRTNRDHSRLSERLDTARSALRQAEAALWKDLLKQARWRSPLLVMDEAHHLKNPGTSLARQLQSPDAEADLKTGDGAMAGAFDRMLFLTATPFQLGHRELVRVLKRFGDVRWDRQSLGERDRFQQQMAELENSLDDSQRSVLALQRRWWRLRHEDWPGEEGVDNWWHRLRQSQVEQLTYRQRSLIEAFSEAERCRREAEDRLRPWLIRHNKERYWQGTTVQRRKRLSGAAVTGIDQQLVEASGQVGIAVPKQQLLPFFLAARSAVDPRQKLLGEALCSSYEAFRHTRRQGRPEVDDREVDNSQAELANTAWYLREFDRLLDQRSGAAHPKTHATVQSTVDLWERGEKVLIFAFYRQTCRALQRHISQEIERRTYELARRRLAGVGGLNRSEGVDRVLQRIQKSFFDDPKASGRRSLDRALERIVSRRKHDLEEAGLSADRQGELIKVMRSFLRVRTTLVRTFPIHDHDAKSSSSAVRSMLDTQDRSGLAWRDKFERFIEFLLDDCSPTERDEYLDAARHITTRRTPVNDSNTTTDGISSVLANVRLAIGTTHHQTRARLMRAFNTPFFPDVLVCSRVMGEGVDLQRHCRQVIHHDLAWNPSDVEQRTGRIDRLGCKAEGSHPIHVYLPYLNGTADERQFRVMNDRERWFRIVMGQDTVAELVPTDNETPMPTPPAEMIQALTFNLSLF